MNESSSSWRSVCGWMLGAGLALQLGCVTPGAFDGEVGQDTAETVSGDAHEDAERDADAASDIRPGEDTTLADSSAELDAEARAEEEVERIEPLVLEVNTTDVDVDGTCDAGHCSLPEAIHAANAAEGLPEPALVRFAIPAVQAVSTGMRTYYVIAVSSPMQVTQPVILDGTTQREFDPAQAVPVIQLDGSGVDAPAGKVLLNLEGAGSELDGIAIVGFPGASSLRLGGAGSAVRRLWLGLPVDSTQGPSVSSDVGVVIAAPDVQLGQHSADESLPYTNVIAALRGVAVDIEPLASDARVVGTWFNYSDNPTATNRHRTWDGVGIHVSTEAPRTHVEACIFAGSQVAMQVRAGGFEARLNRVGVGVGGAQITPGGVAIDLRQATEGPAVIANNVLTRAGANGAPPADAAVIRIRPLSPSDPPAHVDVIGNGIGQIPGGPVLGNRLPAIVVSASDVTISSNTIAGCDTDPLEQGDAVRVLSPARRVIIRSNEIVGNSGLGIDLSAASGGRDGVTLNDSGDTDEGGNGLLNFPEIRAVSGADLVSQGTLEISGCAPGGATLDFYLADDSVAPQGATPLGSCVEGSADDLNSGTDCVYPATHGSGSGAPFTCAIAVSTSQAAALPTARLVSTATLDDFGTSEFEAVPFEMINVPWPP